MRLTSKLWIGIGILALLTPLGIILPQLFKAGPAWGEWELFPELWKAPLPDYISHSWFGYVFSAAVGIMAVVILIFLLGKLLTDKDEK
jgi:cobalt/nickel transport protein